MKKKTDKNNRVIGVVLLVIGVLAIVVAFPHINEMVSQSGSDQAISVEYDKIDKIRGMDIIFVTTAKTDEEAKELLALLGMPFAK